MLQVGKVFPRDERHPACPYSNALLPSACASFDSRLMPMPFNVATVFTRPFNCAFSDRPATGAAGPVPAPENAQPHMAF